MTPISSWGRLDASPHSVITLSDPARTPELLMAHSPGLAYGMGRSYGDVCLNPGGVLWNTRELDHFTHFDDASGELSCEAGVLLHDIQRIAIPRGWMLPVTPGTQWVTVGGAIANDVHGKNHHQFGTFGDYVRRIVVMRTDGEIIECAPDFRSEWFAATVGGIGLTGVILAASIQLRRVGGPWLDTETLPYSNLEEFFQLSEESAHSWEHTVSWIDCITAGGGRGIFLRGRHADLQLSEPRRRILVMPFVPPVSLVNRMSLQAFNTVYFHLKKWRTGRAFLHYQPFFYPLDNVRDWNRMYGPRGFFQYQSVVPIETGREVIRAMLREISRSGNGSFLAVLKLFGWRKTVGMMSFPRPGVTLALDFPNHGERTLKLFQRLDAIVGEAGGRLYLAKDARMPRSLLEAGYPECGKFLKYRDPRISSSLSRRLLGS